VDDLIDSCGTRIWMGHEGIELVVHASYSCDDLTDKQRNRKYK
jgi:hypothetical protein